MTNEDTYGWIITEDVMDEDEGGTVVGTTGPSTASPEVLAALTAGEGDEFKMYDDDGELYLVGRGVDLDGTWDDDPCYAPLSNFGGPAYGATEIRWTNHRERDI